MFVWDLGLHLQWIHDVKKVSAHLAFYLKQNVVSKLLQRYTMSNL